MRPYDRFHAINSRDTAAGRYLNFEARWTPHFDPEMASRVHRDLSDNTHRGAVLNTLIQETSKQAPPPLPVWTSPNSDAEPSVVSNSTGVVWKVANNLKVLGQYTRFLTEAVKTNYFLKGAPSTCVQGLEWFFHFAQPVQPLKLDEYQKVNEYLAACAKASGASIKRAAFDMHRNVCKPERNFTQVLVEQHFPGQHTQYELDVCAYMLAQPELTYEAWKTIFPKWRESGLYYPLAIASVYMPHISSWLPAEVHGAHLATAMQKTLDSMQFPANIEDHWTALGDLEDAWKLDTSGSADILSNLLDRLAVLMRVKSNGRGAGCCLQTCLDQFAASTRLSDNMHEQNYFAWHSLKKSIEEGFPPSLLSAPLVKPKRETWGFKRLTLDVELGDVDANRVSVPTVRFAESSLEHITAECATASCAHTYTPPFIKECMLHQTSQRVQDALWRLGELIISPEISSCILEPQAALARWVPTHEDKRNLASQPPPQPAHVLHYMDTSLPPEQVGEGYSALIRALEGMVPPIVTNYFPHPNTLLMWRLDTPPRAILYVGEGADVDPYATSQHHLPKIMAHAKLQQSDVGGIVKALYNSTEDSVRDCLKSFAADGLSAHASNTCLLMKLDSNGKRVQGEPVTPVTCTTLAESVACFALTKPPNTSNCNLHESCTWKKGGIDPRYAEKQLARNGFRYRDWTAIHVGKSTQQSRLASHVMSFEYIHTTLLPWIQADNTVKWVRMSSSTYPEIVTTLEEGKTLRQAVESRFLHDLRMLPNEHGLKIERSQCEVYTDPSGAVAIAYAPSGIDALQFVHFSCNEPMQV